MQVCWRYATCSCGYLSVVITGVTPVLVWSAGNLISLIFPIRVSCHQGIEHYCHLEINAVIERAFKEIRLHLLQIMWDVDTNALEEIFTLTILFKLTATEIFLICVTVGCHL